ncbi:MAG: S1 RNA-binding domain-containing protein [Elusimicrobia bacterium]|nr:S1 RNA-binding domain-containing protein [Elusimicrobiota bacterium]MDE2313145.1 S1 RNA-binding domain-containing protein [Elusimicrobiota bacterium]
MEEGMGEKSGEEAAAEGGESMQSLLEQQDMLSKKLSERQVAWVKVIQVTDKEVLVDIGEKQDGAVALSEFEKAPAAGQRVAVVLMSRRGGISLSHKQAILELGWQTCRKAYEEKARVRGRVKSSIKGGFLVDVGGVPGFMPASLADLRPVRNPERMVGTGVRCTIIELNEAKKQVVISRKAVLEEEAGKRREKILSELKPGQIRIGRVVRAGPSGVAVDIGGLEGFVRLSDLAWGKPDMKAFERGTKLRLKVLSKPAEEGEPVLFGAKQLLPNPADAVAKKYPAKTIVKAEVLEVLPDGVKIKITDKQAGFCPLRECEEGAAYKPGDRVSAVVLGVRPETFEVSLSLKRYAEIEGRKKAAQYLAPPKPLTLGDLLSPGGE